MMEIETTHKARTKCMVSNVRPLRRPAVAPRRATTSSSTALSVRSTVARPVRRDAQARKHLQLEYDVQKLRAEVARLQQLRQILETAVMNRADNHGGAACRLVRTYFDVFQRGYVVPSPLQLRASNASRASSGGSNPGSPAPSNSNPIDPDAFLGSVMDEDVLGGGFRGVDVMIEQWKRYSTAFVGTKLQFLTAEISSVDVEPESGAPSRIHITATGKYDGHLTLAGVEGMFPHVMSNARLVVSLIGQNIGGFGRYMFVYDCQQKRVVEQLIDIDLISAFAKVVSNAADLALLFGDALVTEQYYMGGDSEEKRAQVQRSDDSPPTTPSTSVASVSVSTPTLTSDEEEYTRKEMHIDRILCT
jgi:hypothetical protein